MKTRPRNCSGGSRSSLLSLLKFSLAVLWPLLAGGLAWGQNQAAQPSAATGRAQDQEAKYQTALTKGQEAQRNYFFVTALFYYQEALKAKPGDEVATKLQSEMRAKINARASGATGPGFTAPPAVGEPPVSVPSQTVSPPATPAEQPVPPPATEESSAVPSMSKAPRTMKHEVSASGDFLYGQGQVTVPFGFSLAESGLGAAPTVGTPTRSSTYYGGTLSYSYGQTWFLDLSYAHGDSSGDFDVPIVGGVNLPTSFSIKDDWYQAYIRYTFPGLRGKRLSAYLRGGISYVTADLTDGGTIEVVNLPVTYHQTDKTTDLLGNFGFGLGYSLYTTRRFRMGLQFEGEGFYGSRSQESLETLSGVGLPPGFPFVTAQIDNTLYGGIGRATVRFEYRLGRSGLFKVFADGGMEVKYTQVEYSGLGTFDELLWGPYVKLGFRYDF